MKHVQMGLLALCLLSFSACEGEVVSSAAAPGEKSLFSNWSYQSGSTTVSLDFSGVGFGSQPYFLYLSGGGACGCMMNIAGTQSSGAIILASCVYSSLGTGGADPGCSLFDSTTNYTKTADTLTMCKVGAGVCYDYK